MSDLSDKVEQIEKQRDDLAALCSEMLATILIEKNQFYFKTFPPEWHEMVRMWTENFKEIKRTIPLESRSGVNTVVYHSKTISEEDRNKIVDAMNRSRHAGGKVKVLKGGGE